VATAPASNYSQWNALTNGEIYIQYANSALKWLSSAAGTIGFKKFLVNDTADFDVSGWSTYADAAGAAPVDCTGGSPSSTFTQGTSNTLEGAGSFLWTKSANNRQGEGASNTITIPASASTSVLEINFDYAVGSGTFAAGTSSTDSDMTVWIYDATNSVLIQPTTYKLYSNSTNAQSFRANFQTAAIAPGSTNTYRVCVHTSTTSASAYTLKLDNFNVIKSKYVYGTPITDWASWTPTFSGAGSVTGIGMQWRRVGSNFEAYGTYTTGTATATTAAMTLPTGLVISLPGSNYPVGDGYGLITANPGTKNTTIIGSNGGTSLNFSIDNATVAVSPTSPSSGSTVWFNSSVYYVRHISVPIQGWGSTTQMADIYDGRIAAVILTGSATTCTSTVTAVTPSAVTADTLGAFSGSTFTAKLPGFYDIKTFMFGGNVSQVNGNILALLYSYNGGSNVYYGLTRITVSASQSYGVNGTAEVYMNGGDTLVLKHQCDVSQSPSGWLTSIVRRAGPTSITPGETVAMRYNSLSSTSMTGSYATNVLKYTTKDYDTHGAYNTSTGVYTCPIAGLYKLECQFAIASPSASVDYYSMTLKNGAAVKQKLHPFGVSVTPGYILNVEDTIQCNAGQTLSCAEQHGTASAYNYSGNANQAVMAITKIGM
jgi:hypothetical protein